MRESRRRARACCRVASDHWYNCADQCLAIVSDWDVRTQADTVAVVAFTATFDVVLFEQFRVGPARAIVEIPGGAVDEGETPVEAAVRIAP